VSNERSSVSNHNAEVFNECGKSSIRLKTLSLTSWDER
jgi:hypothetical protein